MKKFYEEGLFFKCQKCGNCCSGFSGFVWLLEEEIEKISNFLKIPKKDFLKKYTKRVFNKISLKELLPYYDCIFFKNKKCSIYKIRPLQCKTYPFWPQNLSSKKAWSDVKKHCPGVQNKKHKIPKEIIEKNLIQSKKIFN